MDNQSNSMVSYLQLNSNVYPHFFGITEEAWLEVGDAVNEYCYNNVLDRIIRPLLKTQPASYWIGTNHPWPYPDTEFITDLCRVIDNAASSWPIPAKTFMLSMNLQRIIQVVMTGLQAVYHNEMMANDRLIRNAFRNPDINN